MASELRRGRARIGRALPVVAALSAVACGCPDGDVVRLVSPGGRTDLELCAQVVTSEADRRRGLMGHEPLGPAEGMLFEIPVETEVCIYNEGVDFAIDVLYADFDGDVVAIERDVPASDPTIRCHEPVRFVLETAAGQLAEISRGHRLER